ncbi:MAG: glycosyltransferase family 4 protein [Xanthobacteraceae bacterium]
MLRPTNCLLAINNYYYRRGGAEVLFLEHNRMFEAAGWQVVPFAMRHSKNLASPWADYFPDEIEFGSDYGIAGKLMRAPRVIYSSQARRQMKRLLNEVRPSIAHAHNIYHHLSPSVLPLLKERGVPVVMTLHDLKLACPAYTMMSHGKPCERCRGGRIYNVAVNRCIKGSLALSSLVMIEAYVHSALGLYADNVARFVVPSRFLLEKLVQWGWSRERFVHIPNFVDIDRFKPGKAAGRRFVYCGRLDELKGIETLVRAAALARQPLTIIGNGPLEERLRALSAELGTDVHFPGYLTKDALVAAIGQARAVVVPSECHENAPLALLEAYAAGRPVIGSRIAGIPELVREDETGMLYPAGDVAALADTLARAAALPDARISAMGASARAWVERDFNAAVYIERQLALYDSLGVRVR